MRHTDSRPAYGRIKRLRRSVLRAAGRWTRKDYDVRLVFENDRPVYKQVVSLVSGKIFEQIQLVIHSVVLRCVVANRKRLLHGHFLEQCERQNL